jgi:hypothetical protein
LETFARNALQPLSGISGDGIDLTYVYFDPVSAANDLAYIQEVKTTAANNLDYLNRLKDDYQKLFSTNVNLTLQTRIQCLSNSFEVERNNDAYAERVQYLGAKNPKECSRVWLIPTGVHELGARSWRFLSQREPDIVPTSASDRKRDYMLWPICPSS